MTQHIQGHSVDQVSAALNRAADDIIAAAELPETGTIDALNLLVNAALSYLADPSVTLADVARDNYITNQDGQPGWTGQDALAEIISWIGGN